MGIDLDATAVRRLLATGGPPLTITEVLAVVAATTSCDVVSWSRLDIAGRRVLDGATLPADVAETDSALDAVFWEHYHEHPLCHGAGEHVPVCAITDVLDGPAWRRTGLYAEYFRPSGLEHEIGVKLSHPPGQTNVLLLDRGPGPAFDEHDRLVLTLLRPHLDAAVRRIIEPGPDLTRREREILALVRRGLTNRAIGHRLGVSAHTVRKHLENAFARLGVHSRTEAVVALETEHVRH
ncbi:helix-turn-helix transcriptional regulator [Actinoplanes sp. NBC_00393]|uniref:response regulator transcription factor n=1 Tax=Actinoplanes sp. NBC_00393 TaxID=2975953 RepID=UPI002E1C4C78